MSYVRLKVTFGNLQPIMTNAAGYQNYPRKLSAESWCSVSLKFLEWQIHTLVDNFQTVLMSIIVLVKKVKEPVFF